MIRALFSAKTLVSIGIMATLTGCSHLNQIAPSPESTHEWNFHAYEITGNAQVLSGEGNTHVLLPMGVSAKTVSISGNPTWKQNGALIEIPGQPESIEITGQDGSEMKAKLKMVAKPEPVKTETEGADSTLENFDSKDEKVAEK